MRINLDEIKSEVLADNVIFGKINGYEKEWNINGEKVTFGVEKSLEFDLKYLAIKFIKKREAMPVIVSL